MAGNAAEVLEDDLEEEIPAGAGNEGGHQPALRPVEQPQIRQEGSGADQFQIIETDDQGNDLESSLEQGSGTGDQPLIEAGRGTDGQDPNSLVSQRKISRAQRRQKQKQGREQTLRENSQLRAQVAELSQRLDGFAGDLKGIKPQLSELERGRVQSSLNGVASQIDAETRKFNEAKRNLASAVTSSDTDALNAALDARDQAFITIQRLGIQKNQLEATLKAAAAPAADSGQRGSGADSRVEREPADSNARGQQQPAPLSPAVMARIEEFQQSYPWYTGNPNDPDSRTVLWLDRMAAAENLDPSSDDYWDYVEDRMEKLLPHRFSGAAAPGGNGAQRGAASGGQNGQRQQPQQRQVQQGANGTRRGPPTAGAAGSGGGNAPKGQVRISPQRKEAMIAAGIIDNQGNVMDQKKLQNVLRKYSDYDRVNGAA